MDETKLYDITSETYTSKDSDNMLISEFLLTSFERGKIRMVGFKEIITKNGLIQ